jgi:hypothetical protein
MIKMKLLQRASKIRTPSLLYVLSGASSIFLLISADLRECPGVTALNIFFEGA